MTTIHVTAHDIRYGVRGSATHCPVANALHRQGYPRPNVSKAEIKLPTGEHWPLPEQAKQAIEQWDDGGDLAPFAFSL